MPYNRRAISGDYATETFYFPLSVQVEDEDSEDLYNVSSDSVRWFEDEIQDAIDDYQSDIEMEQYLCDENEEIQRKLIAAEWGVETLKGELYGCMKLTLKEPLTAEETEQMRSEVTGQASDGYVQKNNMLKRNRYSPKNRCQRPGILSSRSERILSVRDKVKCQGGDKEKLTQPEGNVSFRKREQKLPAKNHEALRSLPSVALSSVVGKSLSIKRVHGT